MTSTPMNNPLLIIGLDGASFNLLDKLSAAGHTPHLDRLRSAGIACDLQSTIPPVTLPAWTSFLTGVDPGEHGVTDLLQRQGYNLFPMHSGLRCAPTWLNHTPTPVSAHRTCILGVPGTYPPEPIQGVMVSGFDAPGAHEAGPDAVYPAEFHTRLRALGGWRYAVFNENNNKDYRALAKATDRLVKDIGAKEKVALALAHSEPWQLFFVHMQASDTAGHHLWHTYDRNSPRFCAGLIDAIPRIYRRLDRFIGRLCSWAEKRQARILVVSDHGMVGASHIAVHLNRWLHSLGLLSFRQGHKTASPLHHITRKTLRGCMGVLPPQVTSNLRKQLPDIAFSHAMRLMHSSPVEWSNTQAFSFELDYHPAIFLHHQEQFPKSVKWMSAIEQQSLCDKIVEGLMTLNAPGTTTPLVQRVWRRAELCGKNAAHAARFPDLLIEPALVEGYRPSFIPSSGALDQKAVRVLGAQELNAPRGFGMPGQHRAAGIFMLSGPGIAPRSSDNVLEPLDIATAGAFVAAYRGMRIKRKLPPWLNDCIVSEGESYSTVECGGVTQETALPSGHPLQNPAFAKRLRQLGYLN